MDFNRFYAFVTESLEQERVFKLRPTARFRSITVPAVESQEVVVKISLAAEKASSPFTIIRPSRGSLPCLILVKRNGPFRVRRRTSPCLEGARSLFCSSAEQAPIDTARKLCSSGGHALLDHGLITVMVLKHSSQMTQGTPVLQQ